MTYLSGLDASVMIWIASSFREEHLSAISWLNDHTVAPFAFFAIKLRTVRIGDSAIAPLLEVVEQPNDWEREAHRDARMADGERSALGQSRAERWATFSARNPDLAIPDGYAASSYWLPTENPAVFVAMFLGENRVGVFYRGPRNDEGAAREALRPHAEHLEAALGVPFRDKDGQYTLYHRRGIDANAPDDRAAADEWLGERANAYVTAINTLSGSNDLDGGH